MPGTAAGDQGEAFGLEVRVYHDIVLLVTVHVQVCFRVGENFSEQNKLYIIQSNLKTIIPVKRCA